MSYFDDNEDYLTGENMINKMFKKYYNNDLRSDEFIDGILKNKSFFQYTKNNKKLCKVILNTEDGDINIVAWEEEAEKLNELDINDKIIISGYRKFNDFLGKEEFIIKQIIKREFRNTI